jgi:hypothetical protein
VGQIWSRVQRSKLKARHSKMKLAHDYIPYEYCAYRFLEMWERDEKPLHRAMLGTPSAGQIRDALKHYRVARTFKGLSEDSRIAEKISENLLEVSDGCKGNHSDKVTSLAKRFKETFGQFNLSAASKLLWLRNRSPYLIYDARTVNALRCLGNRFDNYISYCEAWEREYKKRSSEISLAAHGIVNLPRKYTAAFSLTDDQLTGLVQSKWFIERVFDIYLWEIGSATKTE